MSDDLNMNGSSQAPQPTPTVLPPAPKSRLNTGRLALYVAGGIVLLAVIVGIVMWVFASSQSTAPTANVVIPPVSTGTGTGGTGSTAASTTLAPIPDVGSGDIFTPRNPFKVIPAPTIGTSTSNDGVSSTTTGTTSATSLMLTDIVTVSGVRKAVVSLGGTSYTVAAGDTVGTSAWKVVQVNTSSAVFSYNGDRITISLGSGSSK